MKNRDIISRIRNTVKEHNIDSLLTDRHIYSILITKAKLLIKRDADSKGTIYNQTLLFDTLCIPMEEVSLIECDVWLPIDCTIYKSKCKLPRLLESSNGIIYRMLSSIDRSVQFTIVTPYQWEMKAKIKTKGYTAKEKLAFIQNGYLYTPNANWDMLLLTGILEDNGEMSCVTKKEDTSKNLKSNCGGILEQEFPAPDYLLDGIVSMSLQELTMYKQIQSDRLANKDDKEIVNTI